MEVVVIIHLLSSFNRILSISFIHCDVEEIDGPLVDSLNLMLTMDVD